MFGNNIMPWFSQYDRMWKRRGRTKADISTKFVACGTAGWNAMQRTSVRQCVAAVAAMCTLDMALCVSKRKKRREKTWLIYSVNDYSCICHWDPVLLVCEHWTTENSATNSFPMQFWWWIRCRGRCRTMSVFQRARGGYRNRGRMYSVSFAERLPSAHARHQC